MRLRGYVGAVVLIMMTAGCASTPDIKTGFDASADFSRYHSYGWAMTSAPGGMDPALFEQVRTSIDRALSARSFTRDSPGDFAIAFTLGRRDSVQVSDFGSYAPYYSAWNLGPTYHEVDIRQITRGTLVIDIYDTASRKPVWHGIATQQIDPSRIDPVKVDAAIDAVLARFPPA